MNKLNWWLALGVAALCSPAAAQLPDSPTGRGGNTVIALFTAGPEALTHEYAQTTFDQEILGREDLDSWLRSVFEALARIGPLELRAVEKTGPFAATIMARSSLTDDRVEIRYRVAETAPHAIAELVIEEAARQPRQPLTSTEFAAAALDLLASLSENEFSGVVLVARGDQVLFEQAKGMASRRFAVPNNLQTRFNLGSINKLFTKIAIAQLAAAGKLDFDDTVAEHLPGYPNPEVARKITIQQVVTHSAGLGDIFTPTFGHTDKRQFSSASDYFPLFANEPLLFEPGTGQRYSNGGYMVLGAIIEAVSGRSYDDYIQEHAFDPAGMTASGSFPMDEPVPNLAIGYTRSSGEEEEGHHESAPDPSTPLRENSFLIPFSGTPAGGGYSTAEDLLRFSRAFTDYRLLDPRYTEWVVSDRLPEKAPSQAAFAIGVAGGAPGVNAELEIGGEYTVVVLANLDPPAASHLARSLRELLEAIEE